jgi:hypothetical protein
VSPRRSTFVEGRPEGGGWRPSDHGYPVLFRGLLVALVLVLGLTVLGIVARLVVAAVTA